MSNYQCHECHRPITNGQAVIRSESLTRVARHKDCAALVGIQDATLVVEYANKYAPR
jgi:hypothetical protein